MSTIADRSKFLGGTDTAAVMGLSKWKTRRDVFNEKTGRIIEDADPSDAMVRGTALEP